MKKGFQDKMERVNIDEALENAGQNLKEEINLFSHALFQIGMIVGAAVTFIWGLISSYHQTAYLAVPMIWLFLAEDYLWNKK